MVKVLDLTGKAVGEINLPKVFSSTYRPDLVHRAVVAAQRNRIQPYGANKLAGQRTSAHYHGRRGSHNSMMNREMARLPRTHGGGSGQEMRAAFVPQATGGRKAHPPKSEKVWAVKINKKERIVALKSAIASTVLIDLVSKKHKVSKIELPIIVKDAIEEIKKTSNLEKILGTIGIYDDLKRAKVKKVRAGKGKMRGRKYKRKKSVLLVVKENKGIVKAALNIPGVDICNVKGLNVEILAPGAVPGRLVVWSEGAIKELGEIYG
jgi:large subunit ribosomal protein L4e